MNVIRNKNVQVAKRNVSIYATFVSCEFAVNSNNESVREEELTAFIDLRRARGASSLPFERRARTYAREAACFRPLRRTAPSGGSRKISHQGHPMSGSTPNCTTSQQIELGLTATHRSTDRTRKGGVAYAGESSGKGAWVGWVLPPWCSSAYKAGPWDEFLRLRTDMPRITAVLP